MLVRPVAPEDLTPALREQWEPASPGGRTFVEVMAQAPDHAERLFAYYNAIRYGTVLGHRTCELLRLAIARTTRCPNCLAGRSAAAFEEGLTETEAVGVSEGRTAGLDERDRAIVEFAYAFGSDHFSIGQPHLDALHAHLDERGVVEVAMLCAQFLGFGRVAMVLQLEDPVCVLPGASLAAEADAAR
ncbi:hypothetical protein GCM10028777_39950 [Angustibacter speluncae]